MSPLRNEKSSRYNSTSNAPASTTPIPLIRHAHQPQTPKRLCLRAFPYERCCPGEPLGTPTPAELAKLPVNTQKVGLDFAKVFEGGRGDFEDDEDGVVSAVRAGDGRTMVGAI
jgi:hypothetical protein